jgi:hydrogenase-4 membrane subunit HyfE
MCVGLYVYQSTAFACAALRLGSSFQSREQIADSIEAIAYKKCTWHDLIMLGIERIQGQGRLVPKNHLVWRESGALLLRGLVSACCPSTSVRPVTSDICTCTDTFEQIFGGFG